MAVRAFDLSESPRPRLTVLEGAPVRRRDRRRLRQQWMALGALALALPFAAAIIVLGVVH